MNIKEKTEEVEGKLTHIVTSILPDHQSDPYSGYLTWGKLYFKHRQYTSSFTRRIFWTASPNGEAKNDDYLCSEELSIILDNIKSKQKERILEEDKLKLLNNFDSVLSKMETV